LTVLLAQSIGWRNAVELSLSARFITAGDALRLGLVNHVVPHDELLPFCRKLAADSITIEQRAVRRMLATYTEVTDTTIGQGWEVEDRVSREWEGAGFDPSAIEARRLGIVERGRSQIAKE
jgi:enoyl-CoA hydratase